MTPRTVSITKVKGVAYIFTKDFVSSKVSPQIIPPQKAAPNATVSSGFFSLGFFSIKIFYNQLSHLWNMSWTPNKTISSILYFYPESSRS